MSHDERNGLRVLNLEHVRHGLGIHPLQRIEPRIDAAIHGFKQTGRFFWTECFGENGFDVVFSLK